MLHKRNILICLTAVSLCLTGIALGKAVKQELLGEGDQVLGKAILNYAEDADKTEIQVNCRGLEPETEYTVVLCEIDEQGNITDLMVIGSFTTNNKGKGHLHARLDGDVSDWCVLVGIVGDDGAVTPCAYDKKRVGLEPVLPIVPVPGEPPRLEAPEVDGRVTAGLVGEAGNYISFYFVCDARRAYELGRARIDFTGTNVKIDYLGSVVIPPDDRIVNQTKVGDQILEIDFQGFTSGEEVVLGLDLDLLSSGSGTPYGSTYEGGVVELSFVGPPVPGRNPVVAIFAETGTFTAEASF